MKINILLPYKEKFDINKASSVSITVKNNLLHSNYTNQTTVYGQNVENPILKDNFTGIDYSIFSFKSKNIFLLHEMLKIISKDIEKKQLIEIHNRPYLVNRISKIKNYPISLFFHNDPLTMKGSKTKKDREIILKNCAAVFCVSEFIKTKFIQGLSENLEKIHILHNGVERKLKTFPKKKKEILFVGRLVPEKGVHIYVDVIHSIAHKFPDWEFSLIGSYRLGDDKIVGSFVSKVVDKFDKIGKQSKFYGFKNQSFVHCKMKTSAIVVIPSIWEEPFGLVAAEAMSNGAAIIASDIGGIPEIVKKNGILISDINKVKLENELFKLMSNNRKRTAIQRLSWNNFECFSEKSAERLDKFRKIIFQKFF